MSALAISGKQLSWAKGSDLLVPPMSEDDIIIPRGYQPTNSKYDNALLVAIQDKA